MNNTALLKSSREMLNIWWTSGVAIDDEFNVAPSGGAAGASGFNPNPACICDNTDYGDSFEVRSSRGATSAQGAAHLCPAEQPAAVAEYDEAASVAATQARVRAWLDSPENLFPKRRAVSFCECPELQAKTERLTGGAERAVGGCKSDDLSDSSASSEKNGAQITKNLEENHYSSENSSVLKFSQKAETHEAACGCENNSVLENLQKASSHEGLSDTSRINREGCGCLEREILDSRLGGFGSSDAKMLYNIGLRGSLTAGDKERIACYLGLKKPSSKSTETTENGHRREAEIYMMQTDWWDEYGNRRDLSDTDYESNPCIKNTELTQKSGIRCFTHIDIVEKEFRKHAWQIAWSEVKTSKDATEKVLSDYRWQLFWHYWALEDYVTNQHESEFGVDYYELYLLHYKEDDIGGKFDRSKIKSELFDFEDAELANFKETILAGLKVVADSLDAVQAGYVERGRQYLARQDFPEEVAIKLEHFAKFLLEKKKFDEIEAQLKENLRATLSKLNWKKCDTPWFVVSLNPDSTRSILDANKVKSEYPKVYSECLKSSLTKGSLRLELSKSYIAMHSNDTVLERGEAALEVGNV